MFAEKLKTSPTISIGRAGKVLKILAGIKIIPWRD
jgi:hypothetical protein